MSSVEMALVTITSPMILFFALGLGAALLRSQMTVPEAFSKGLAIYLMMAIGLKGGVAMSNATITTDVVMLFVLGFSSSLLMPFLAYAYLRIFTDLSVTDAAATAGHYGSISIVTFVAGTQVLQITGIPVSGYMVAVAAIMEVPAIVSALWLARSVLTNQSGSAGFERGEILREVFLNASVVVLIGSMVIGYISGTDGMDRIAPLFVSPFEGVLCLFLLDMGLNAGRGLRHGWRALTAKTLAFGIILPLTSAVITAVICGLLGFTTGDTALMIVLAASASYIAVPAAMRLVLPKAQPAIYLTLSLGVTFPFNLVIGIPIYISLAQYFTG